MATTKLKTRALTQALRFHRNKLYDSTTSFKSGGKLTTIGFVPSNLPQRRKDAASSLRAIRKGLGRKATVTRAIRSAAKLRSKLRKTT